MNIDPALTIQGVPVPQLVRRSADQVWYLDEKEIVRLTSEGTLRINERDVVTKLFDDDDDDDFDEEDDEDEDELD